MVHFAAIDCTNSSSKKNGESIGFFKFAKDPERKKLRISKLKRKNLPKKENIYVITDLKTKTQKPTEKRKYLCVSFSV